MTLVQSGSSSSHVFPTSISYTMLDVWHSMKQSITDSVTETNGECDFIIIRRPDVETFNNSLNQ